MAPRPHALLLALVLCAAPDGESLAAWPHDPVNGNVPISTGAWEQRYPSMLSDGAGGAFIAWHDSRNGGFNYDIYMQRVSATGVPLWTANGVSVCGAPADQANTTLVSDGAGGVIVVWHDLRGATWDIYAQRVNASGVAQWAANGVAVCTAIQHQTNPVAVTDGSGGVIAVWTDERSDEGDIYAQKVNASGVPQWAANGVVITNATYIQTIPDAISDGAGGAIVVWRDSRYSGQFPGALAMQRVNGSGIAQWALNGDFISNGHETAVPKIAPDGAGGAITTWQGPDYNNSSLGINAHRMSSAGVELWTFDGVSVCAAGSDQTQPSIAADGHGGAIIAWRDYRASGYSDIYAQRVSASGAPHWTVDGVQVSGAAGSQSEPMVTSVGTDVIVTWLDDLTGLDLYAQSLNASGGWATNGVPVSLAAGNQSGHRIVTDGAGGAIIAWHDSRSGNNDIYAQRVDRFGALGHPEPTIVSVADVPNDQGGRVQVQWTASYLDAWPTPDIDGYSIWRRVPNPEPQASIESDPHIRKMATVDGTQAVYWEYLVTLPPRGFPGYSYVAATTSDQLPGSNPYTSFMILAEKEGGFPYWSSTPDSGYSIDNLAPAAPAPLTGTYDNGSTTLQWGPNDEADLAAYRIYRGGSADFIPGPSNLVASLLETNHVDVAGAPAHYKVSAVDVHGNESAFALLSPSGTVGVSDPTIDSALGLAIPQPNPARLTTGITFDLPRATDVSLVVHDASGRIVRVMVRGHLDAGRISRTWDLRDDSGSMVGSGLYFVRLQAEGRSLSRRIVAIR